MKKGFTLIELLVVIAIIAILAAILFPVFAQAREKARATQCLSNCKQLGTSLQLYCDDYDETLPFFANTAISRWDGSKIPDDIKTNYSGYPLTELGFKLTPWGADTWTWADCLFPYVKNINMYVCPSGGAINGTYVKKKIGYAYNILLAINSSGTAFGWNAASSNCVTFSLSQLKHPASLVFFADNLQYAQSHASKAWCYSYVCNKTVSGYEETAQPNTFDNPNRHNGGANYTFCDGHAKFYKKGQGPSEYLGNNDGGNNIYWGPYYQ